MYRVWYFLVQILSLCAPQIKESTEMWTFHLNVSILGWKLNENNAIGLVTMHRTVNIFYLLGRLFQLFTYVYEIWGLHVPFLNVFCLSPNMDLYSINFWNQTHIWPNLQENSLKKNETKIPVWANISNGHQKISIPLWKFWKKS